MSHSNSSLNCFANCMAKYNHCYVLHTPPCKPTSPHLTFGTMAHEVLYNAGKLRDESADGVLNVDEYQTVIPSEVLYNDLKEYFDIKSWEGYFTAVIKQTYEYEQELIKEYKTPVKVERELKLSFTPEQMKEYTGKVFTQSFVGVIDLLIITDNAATIIDYKFSSTNKTQNDFDMNSQLPLYAFFVNKMYGIPIHNIKVGYIDIPKVEFGRPIILSNGTLSRAKSQNCSKDIYKRAVYAVHGDDPVYNCEPGGYYYDIYCNLALKKSAYLNVQYLDEEAYNGILNDLFDAAKMIDFMSENKFVFLRKYDSYSCSSCEYVKACKPWLNINFGE